MSLKVLLVLPIREGNNFQVAPDCGILYLGTVLRNQGFDVTLLDCPKEEMTFREFEVFVREGSFDVVGFRCYSRDHNYVNHHLGIVKSVDPAILDPCRWSSPFLLSPSMFCRLCPISIVPGRLRQKRGWGRFSNCLRNTGRKSRNLN